MAKPTNSSFWNSLLETLPESLKLIQKYVKVSNDIERVDPVIAYWTRFHALEAAFQLDKNSIEAKACISKMLVLLENFKEGNKDNEKVSSNDVALANFENFVFNLFNKADSNDRNGKSDSSTVKMFYMASVLLECLESFGPVSEDVTEKIRYSKFKAAYIQKCLKTGQVPKPGPIDNEDFGATPTSTIVLPTIGTSTTTNPQAGHSFNRPAPTEFPVQPGPYKSDISTPSKTTAFDGTKVKKDSFVTSESSLSRLKPEDLTALNGAKLSLEGIIKSQKYIKYATASLSFNDIKNTVENLEKALRLLKTGEDNV